MLPTPCSPGFHSGLYHHCSLQTGTAAVWVFLLFRPSRKQVRRNASAVTGTAGRTYTDNRTKSCLTCKYYSPTILYVLHMHDCNHPCLLAKETLLTSLKLHLLNHAVTHSLYLHSCTCKNWVLTPLPLLWHLELGSGISFLQHTHGLDLMFPSSEFLISHLLYSSRLVRYLVF